MHYHVSRLIADFVSDFLDVFLNVKQQAFRSGIVIRIICDEGNTVIDCLFFCECATQWIELLMWWLYVSKRIKFFHPREIWDTSLTMVVVMSSAIAVIEDFSKDTLGRYEHSTIVVLLCWSRSQQLNGSIINHGICDDVKLAHATAFYRAKLPRGIMLLYHIEEASWK